MAQDTIDEVVCLDACYYPIPSFAIPHNYTEYQTTLTEQIVERAKNATIIVTSRVPISEATLAQCPRLRMIAIMSKGTDIIDHEGCRKRGIRLCNLPAATTESVAEQFLALYFAVKRNVVQMHHLTLQGEEWSREGTAIKSFGRVPIPCRHEVLGIIGYGFLGKRIEGLAKALGMSVLIAERRGVSPEAVRPGRTQFETVLRTSSTVVLSCPLSEETKDLISDQELNLMDKSALLINISRGGVVNEAALVKALQTSTISGAGIDVFEVEPATATSSPLTRERVPNLVLSPHIGWYGSTSLANISASTKANVECFVAGKPQNVVV